MGSPATPLLEVERDENSNRDHFSKLPEFLILRIFRNLQLNQGADIKTLLRCAQVSQLILLYYKLLYWVHWERKSR